MDIYIMIVLFNLIKLKLFGSFVDNMIVLFNLIKFKFNCKFRGLCVFINSTLSGSGMDGGIECVVTQGLVHRRGSSFHCLALIRDRNLMIIFCRRINGEIVMTFRVVINRFVSIHLDGYIMGPSANIHNMCSAGIYNMDPFVNIINMISVNICIRNMDIDGLQSPISPRKLRQPHTSVQSVRRPMPQSPVSPRKLRQPSIRLFLQPSLLMQQTSVSPPMRQSPVRLHVGAV